MVRIYAPFLIRTRINKDLEHQNRYKERYGRTDLKRPTGDIIWFHGASVGESLSILPIIERIAKARPNVHFLITTTTLAAAKVLETRLNNDKILHQFLPFDSNIWVNKFLNHWQPKIAFFIESEIWPNLLKNIHKRQTKTYLLNARLSDKSLRNWKILGGFSKNLWRSFAGIYTQSAEFTKSFYQLGASQAQTLGNIKLLSAPLPFNEGEYIYWKEKIGSRKCWIVASTHEGEEVQIIEVHKKLQEHFPDLLTIIAPRHIQRCDDICKITDSLKIARFSSKSLESEDILLVDAMAKLGVFYRICPIAFIGGSLIPQGGHNPLEPAVIGSFPIWGPYFFNFDDMMPLFENLPCQQLTIAELINTMRNYFSNPEQVNDLIITLQKRIATNQQEISDKVNEILEQI